jgi:hypothetical protein
MQFRYFAEIYLPSLPDRIAPLSTFPVLPELPLSMVWPIFRARNHNEPSILPMSRMFQGIVLRFNMASRLLTSHDRIAGVLDLQASPSGNAALET